jgi:hypothetical protein
MFWNAISNNLFNINWFDYVSYNYIYGLKFYFTVSTELFSKILIVYGQYRFYLA